MCGYFFGPFGEVGAIHSSGRDIEREMTSLARALGRNLKVLRLIGTWTETGSPRHVAFSSPPRALLLGGVNGHLNSRCRGGPNRNDSRALIDGQTSMPEWSAQVELPEHLGRRNIAAASAEDQPAWKRCHSRSG